MRHSEASTATVSIKPAGILQHPKAQLFAPKKKKPECPRGCLFPKRRVPVELFIGVNDVLSIELFLVETCNADFRAHLVILDILMGCCIGRWVFSSGFRLLFCGSTMLPI